MVKVADREVVMAPMCVAERCQKRGVLMTCFVDGRKRFRAAPIDALPNWDARDGSSDSPNTEPAPPGPTASQA